MFGVLGQVSVYLCDLVFLYNKRGNVHNVQSICTVSFIRLMPSRQTVYSTLKVLYLSTLVYGSRREAHWGNKEKLCCCYAGKHTVRRSGVRQNSLYMLVIAELSHRYVSLCTLFCMVPLTEWAHAILVWFIEVFRLAELVVKAMCCVSCVAVCNWLLPIHSLWSHLWCGSPSKSWFSSLRESWLPLRRPI